MDVSYGGRSLCWGSGCNWVEEVCEGEEENPFCGDGVLDAGEQCEVGDPAGTSCTWATCNHTTCACPAVSYEYLQVQGGVYCQDENGEAYPIEGANITFYKHGSQSKTESLVTNASGVFTSAPNTTVASDGAFAVRFENLRSLSQTLPTGVPYSDMLGPVTSSAGICTTGLCDHCGLDYEHCLNLSEGINSGFRWTFTNCSLEEVNPDWDIDKEGTVVCYEEGTENAYAEVSYEITVENVAAGGTVEYVQDTYDPSIDANGILSTTPEATEIDETDILWNLEGDAGEFSEGETQTYHYMVRIPEELFGEELNNHAVAHLSTGEDLHAYEDIFVTCGPYVAPPEEEGPLPETGIFDNTVVRVGLGFLLVALGFGYYRFGLLDGAVEGFTSGLSSVRSKISFTLSKEGRRSRWEQGMIRRARSDEEK
ncbi:MAG: hypothetical protein PHG63_02155 [Candidatus Dojkabacteria bacterium]|nr:hypothetical protein [Candidatus Dojkabacteria bacterium]